MKTKIKAPVSVVIPCFQCESTIYRAVASIRAQTWLPTEVILVDDGSGPATRDVLADLAQSHPEWIKVITLSVNQGAGAARNAGWSVSTQKFVAFLDADDSWHPDKIAVQCKYMEAHVDVVLTGHAHKILFNEKAESHWLSSTSSSNLDSKVLIAVPITKAAILISNKFITPSVMVLRNIKERFKNGQRYMEDHLLWLEIICNGGKVVSLPIELAAIYKHSFGFAGLSSHIWKMSFADLSNYRHLYRQGHISRTLWLLINGFLIVKIGRRLLIQYTRLLRSQVAVRKV
jgi:glycosyltransferase involved in cell wall biosynthesis